MRESFKLESLDRDLLNLLQESGGLSNAKIADAVHLSETPCWRRIKKLEEEGFIDSYTALLNRKRLGYSFQAIVSLCVSSHTPEITRNFEATIAAYPEVLAFYNMTGEYDFVVIVISKNVDTYRIFIENAFRKLDCITKISTSVVLHKIKETTKLPTEIPLTDTGVPRMHRI